MELEIFGASELESTEAIKLFTLYFKELKDIHGGMCALCTTILKILPPFLDLSSEVTTQSLSLHKTLLDGFIPLSAILHICFQIAITLLYSIERQYVAMHHGASAH